LKLNYLTGFGSGAAGAGVSGVRGFHLGGHTYSPSARADIVEQLTYAAQTMAVNTDASLPFGNAYSAYASDTALACYSAGGND